MLFSARNYDSIYEGLSELFAVEINEVLFYLRSVHFEQREIAIKEYIKKEQKEHITDIEFYHLSRSISPHKVLYPLNYLLHQENDLSRFFCEHGIMFSKSENESISLFYNGSRVDEDIISSHFLLGKRLTSDMCICGFQILENIDRYKPGYLYDILEKSPEIVKSIDEVLNFNGNLISDYSRKSKYYCEIGVAKFSQIGFNKGDRCEILPSTDCLIKEELYLYNLISYVLDKYAHLDFRPSTNALLYSNDPIEIIDRVQPKDIWPEELG